MSEKDFNEIFAKNLQFYIEQKGVSQNELAKYLDVSPTSVNNWCRGLKTPRMDKVDKICTYFHIKRSDLLNDHTDSEPEPYYLDPEVAEIAQQIKENPGKRALFDATRDVSKEDIEKVLQIINVITKDD